MRKHLFLLSVLSLSVLIVQGCASGLMGKSTKRATNVEIQVVSQSCFQGELVPCG
jgi:predicted Rossmann-fold nucleotide-binding protein